MHQDWRSFPKKKVHVSSGRYMHVPSRTGVYLIPVSQIGPFALLLTRGTLALYRMSGRKSPHKRHHVSNLFKTGGADQVKHVT